MTAMLKSQRGLSDVAAGEESALGNPVLLPVARAALGIGRQIVDAGSSLLMCRVCAGCCLLILLQAAKPSCGAVARGVCLTPSCPPAGVHCRRGPASSGSPCSLTPEWIDGGCAPHHRSPSRTGVHGDRPPRRFFDRGDPADCGRRRLPYGLPLHGFLGGLLGVGLGAFLVTGGWRDGAGMRVVLDVGRAGVPGRTRLVKLPAV